MNIPFTIEQFLDIFRRYNLTVWPAQVLLVLLAGIAVYISIRKTSFTDKVATMVLAVLWLWMGAVYHLGFFSSINTAAYLFGALFILQGLIFLYTGVIRNKLMFGFRMDLYGAAGAILILFAMAIYPALNQALGHGYPQSPTFGLPCPTTIFTFGILLWTIKAIPKYILIIPAAWAIVGISAAMKLGMMEDVGLFVSAVLAVALIWYRDRKRSGASNQN